MSATQLIVLCGRQVAPAAAAAVDAETQQHAQEQPSQQPPRMPEAGSNGAGAPPAEPRQMSAEGVEQAEQLLDVVFVSSEAGEALRV